MMTMIKPKQGDLVLVCNPGGPWERRVFVSEHRPNGASHPFVCQCENYKYSHLYVGWSQLRTIEQPECTTLKNTVGNALLKKEYNEKIRKLKRQLAAANVTIEALSNLSKF
jgi:hypothetical protein